MRELFFFVDERLPEHLARTTEATSKEAGLIYNNTPVTYAGSTPVGGFSGRHFTEAGPIVRYTRDFGHQRDADKICGEIVMRLGNMGSRFVVFITIDDLTCKPDGRHFLNWCFGVQRGSVVILSIAQFKNWPDEEQKVMLSGLIMHEVGHLYYLAGNPRRAKTENNIGMHCTDRFCVMQQGLNVASMRENLFRVEKATRGSRSLAGRYYCQLCREDIRSYFEPTLASDTFALEKRTADLTPLPPRRTAVSINNPPPLPSRRTAGVIIAPPPLPPRRTAGAIIAPPPLPPRNYSV